MLLINGKDVICLMLLFKHFFFNFFFPKYDFFQLPETLKIAIETVQEFNVAVSLDAFFQWLKKLITLFLNFNFSCPLKI